MNSASLCSLAGRYDNPLPLRFLAPIDFLKIPAQFMPTAVDEGGGRATGADANPSPNRNKLISFVIIDSVALLFINVVL